MGRAVPVRIVPLRERGRAVDSGTTGRADNGSALPICAVTVPALGPLLRECGACATFGET
jgi:hypothetical protein